MPYLKRLVAFLLIAIAQSVLAQEKPAPDDVIIKMEPYIVAGERVLPAPESWHYVSVPALELTRGKKVLIAPGYYILSNLSEKNTRLFVEQLQYFQFAGVYLWPVVMQALPKEPIVVIVDRTKQAHLGTDGLENPNLWQGEPISTLAPAQQNRSSSFSSLSGGMPIATTTIPDAFSTDPNQSETTTTVTTRFVPEGASSGTESSPFQDTTDDALFEGFNRVSAKNGVITVQVNADAPFEGQAAPSEEQLAADLNRKLAEYVTSSFAEPPPTWFRTGLGWLIATTKINPTEIIFGRSHMRLNALGKLPSLEVLLTSDNLSAYGSTMMAAAFTHWGLYGDNNKHATQLMALVQRQCHGTPLTPEEFQGIFGQPYRKIEMEISDYTRSFSNYTYREIRGKLPEMPAFTVVEAKQSDVARLKAESFITQDKADLALNELRIAYWRNEREPVMLSMLADLEAKCGSLERAKKIVQGVLAMKTPPSLAFLVEARIRYREALAGKSADVKLSAQETRSIMSLLGQAIKVGRTNEALCAFFAEVVLRSSGNLPDGAVPFLEMAANRFPKNTFIREAVVSAKGSAPSVAAPEKTPVATP